MCFVTDYSSIFIDFLVTGKPILHFTYDIDEYVRERGFLYDLETVLPSKWFRTPDELLARLESSLSGSGIDDDQYARSKDIFHQHGERPSAQVVKKIGTLLHQ